MRALARRSEGWEVVKLRREVWFVVSIISTFSVTKQRRKVLGVLLGYLLITISGTSGQITFFTAMLVVDGTASHRLPQSTPLQYTVVQQLR